jgi:hypothetical protein
MRKPFYLFYSQDDIDLLINSENVDYILREDKKTWINCIDLEEAKRITREFTEALTLISK